MPGGPNRVAESACLIPRRIAFPLKYRESLPADCPPAEADEVDEVVDVYRLVRTLPPTDSDFRSQRAEHPERAFTNVSECQATGVSVFTSAQEARKKLASVRFRGMHVCRVRLRNGAGRILKTGGGSHHTWWPFAEFDILHECAAV